MENSAVLSVSSDTNPRQPSDPLTMVNKLSSFIFDLREPFVTCNGPGSRRHGEVTSARQVYVDDVSTHVVYVFGI